MRAHHARALGVALTLGGLFGVGTGGLLSSLGSAGCGTSAAGGGTGNQDPAGAPIVLGASISLTGGLEGNAVAMQGGLLAAVAQVNALGGILGRNVVVSTLDDKSDPTQALTVAQSLAAMSASALLGPVGSSMVSADEPFITKSQLVEVSSTATAASLTEGHGAKAGYFFRTVPSDALQAVAVSLFALEGPSPDAGVGACAKMDIVYATDAYGTPLASAIKASFTGSGGTVVSKIGVPENALGSYASQAAEVVSDTPDCLVLAVYAPVAAQFMHDLSDRIHAGNLPAGWNPSFFVIGTDGTYDPSLITSGRASASDPSSQSWVNGTYGPPMYGTVAFGSDHDRQQYNDLLALYTAEVGLPSGSTDMQPYTANQYDAAMLVLLAMEAAGATSGPAFQQALFDVSRGKSCSANPYGPAEVGDAISALRTGGDINYQGASGDVDLNDYGDVIGDFLVWEVQGSAFVDHTTLLSSALATAQPTVDAGGCR